MTDFFYEGGGRRKAVDALFEEIYSGRGVALLTGESGSGRSKVIARFCAEVDPDVLAVGVITGDILMSAEQCLAGMAAALARFALLEGPGIDNLDLVVAAVRDSGRTPVFIVDDAHELGEQPRSVIEAFCLAQTIPLILAGDRTLGRTETARIELPAFTLADSEDFVAGWLAVGDEDELPSHRAIEKLHRDAAGMPGRLAQLLAGGAATRNIWFPAGFPLWHVLFTLVAAGLLLWLLTHLRPSTPAPVSTGEIALRLPSPEALSDREQPPRTRLSAVAVPRALDVTSLPEADAPVADSRALALPPPMEPAAADSALPPLPAAPVPSVTAPSTTAAPVPPAVKLPPPPKVVASPRRTADEQALLAERPGRFTLQLFASFNEQAVRQFAQRHPGQGIRVFRTVREELPWYVAVTGVYHSKEEAKVAAARLPPDLVKLQPWARSLQSIQDELRRRKD